MFSFPFLFRFLPLFTANIPYLISAINISVVYDLKFAFYNLLFTEFFNVADHPHLGWSIVYPEPIFNP